MILDQKLAPTERIRGRGPSLTSYTGGLSHLLATGTH